MRTSLAIVLLLLGASACQDDPPIASGPKRVPARPSPQTSVAAPGDDVNESGTESGDADAEQAPSKLPERPRADPDIERALDLIGASGLRFIDPPDDPDEAPDEYTAEQFASMLRTKWDWLGYDLTELQPWLDEIATRSFKTNRPYRVMLADGTTSEVRPWLDAQLAKQKPP
ncbi:MAG TPA: DUF5329 family protein [Enhygromyxa sp.]|nr:DUF5329 family protein [Enhygromyxa sp.]